MNAFHGTPSFFMTVPPQLNYGRPQHVLMSFWNILIKSIKVSGDIPRDLPDGGVTTKCMRE
jgi:hypothetical protein